MPLNFIRDTNILIKREKEIKMKCTIFGFSLFTHFVHLYCQKIHIEFFIVA